MKICVLAGVGIEVTREALRVLHAIAPSFGLNIETTDHLIGGAAIRDAGDPFPEETRAACVSSDAVLLGAVGSPEFDALPPSERPEIGLLRLRQALGGFANLRPARAFPALIGSSPLREEVFRGTDMMIVRELLGGLYFGEPRGVSADGIEAFNTMRYSRGEVERVARVAFETAPLHESESDRDAWLEAAALSPRVSGQDIRPGERKRTHSTDSGHYLTLRTPGDALAVPSARSYRCLAGSTARGVGLVGSTHGHRLSPKNAGFEVK